jgi:hypothetical protein
LDIPFGYCQCGCGQKTNIAKKSSRGVKKGQPCRFLHGHNPQKRVRQIRLCKFGCGRPARENIKDGKFKGYYKTCGICKMTPGRSAEERFFKKIKKLENGCWLWTGYTRRDGYGQFHDKKVVYAHIWAYKHFKGEIPRGHELHHRCENRACVNPNHLEILTKQDHNPLGESPPAQNNRKTHCFKGHLFSEENTRRDRHGWRYCLTCRSERAKKYYRERRGRQTCELSI